MLKIKAPVSRIIDGDTITIPWSANTEDQITQQFTTPRRTRDEILVRFFGVDAPELGQMPWGDRAKQRLAQLLKPIEPNLILQVTSVDRYSRVVAEPWIDDPMAGMVSLNIQLLSEGWCTIYPRWLRNSDRLPAYLKAYEHARHHKLGVWSDNTFVVPSQWRRNQKNARRNAGE
ncbi:MAG: thermonuclease family protein [Cyanobacteria bacterium P01_F01_bin.153]